MASEYTRSHNRVLRWYGAMHGGHRTFFADVEAFEAAVRAEAAAEWREAVREPLDFADEMATTIERYIEAAAAGDPQFNFITGGVVDLVAEYRRLRALLEGAS